MSNVANGLKLELKPRRSSYSAGELPAFDAVLTNMSNAPVVFCAYQASHRLLSTLWAGGYEVVPFRPTPRLELKREDFVALAPGQSVSYPVDLTQEAARGYRVLWTGSLPPVVEESMAASGFPAGDYCFKVHLGDFISFFTAPEGEAGPRDRVHILNQVPKQGAVPSGAWSGDLVAVCDLTFS